jgi:hypothetical protein
MYFPNKTKYVAKMASFTGVPWCPYFRLNASLETIG